MDVNRYGPPHFGFFEKSAVRVDRGGGEVSSRKSYKISPHTSPNSGTVSRNGGEIPSRLDMV